MKYLVNMTIPSDLIVVYKRRPVRAMALEERKKNFSRVWIVEEHTLHQA